MTPQQVAVLEEAVRQDGRKPAKLSRLCGQSPDFIRNICKLKSRNPNRPALRALAGILGIDPATIGADPAADTTMPVTSTSPAKRAGNPGRMSLAEEALHHYKAVDDGCYVQLVQGSAFIARAIMSNHKRVAGDASVGIPIFRNKAPISCNSLTQ